MTSASCFQVLDPVVLLSPVDLPTDTPRHLDEEVELEPAEPSIVVEGASSAHLPPHDTAASG